MPSRCLLFFLIGWVAITAPAQGVVTPEQREKVKELNEATDAAGKLYAAGKFGECAERVSEIQIEVAKLLESPDVALRRLVKPVYSRLGRAHGLLELEGIELAALPAWSELIEDSRSGGSMPRAGSADVSFKDDIAPLLVSACGNCHINNQRGQFSLATYEDLMKGRSGTPMLFAGSSRGSRLVDVIESGDMPRGGGKVTPEQLAKLKAWIDQGAQFDSTDPSTRLTSLSGAETSSGAAPASTEPRMATGTETVSYARDIAPILMENCNGCHIAGRQASGNLRMDTFAQLLRGGDSGEAIAGSNANQSLLVKKLKGEVGQRMPAGGRPPLTEAQISLISTWIREGATFDGPSPTTNIEVVVNQAWASGASHAELFQRRQERAQQRWAKTLPGDVPAVAENDELLVLGNVPQPRIDATLVVMQDALTQAKKLLKLSPKDPLVKGGISVFVLKSRYDYSEFGRMTESRELPKDWLGHWQADPLDVYAVLAVEGLEDKDQAKSLALQMATGAYLGAFSEVPTWFAEGVARNWVVDNFRRDDKRIVQWQQAMPSAMQKVENAKTLSENRLDEESAGLVGMALTHFMMDRSNRRRFDKLLELLREGRTFEEAATFAFAPPEAIIKTWLGK